MSHFPRLSIGLFAYAEVCCRKRSVSRELAGSADLPLSPAV
jgi:hypothetical protein